MFEALNQIFKSLVQSSQIFSSFESKNYRRYFIGQGISLIGSWMQSIAMSWLVYRLTGSKFLLGFIGFTSQVPSFVLSPYAGVITDRFNRRNIMFWTQVLFMLQAILFSILSFSNLVQVWHIIVLSLFFGLISAFDAPARQSLVIDLIDNPKNLGNAIALNSALFNGARLIGPAIAGIVIALFGEGICFSLNALSYVAIIISLSKIAINKKPREDIKQSVREQLTEGFKYTFGFKPIKTLLILLAVLSLIGLPFVTIMPAYASETLKGESHTYGFLMSAIGAGALIGAIFLASKKTIIGLEKVIQYASVAFGLSLLGMALTKNLAIAMIVGSFGGFCMITTIASVNTLIQTLVDESKRGRVMSFYAMALMGMTPFGSLISGSLASALGISWTLSLSGFITILIGFWFYLIWPKYKEQLSPIYAQKGYHPEH